MFTDYHRFLFNRLLAAGGESIDLVPAAYLEQLRDDGAALRRSPIETGRDAFAAGEPLPAVVGFAMVWNSPFLGAHGEWIEIAPSAFKASLESGVPVKALLDHDPDQCVGATREGSLSVSWRRAGLAVALRPSPCPAGERLVETLRAERFCGMSIGYVPTRSRDRLDGGRIITRICEAELHEVTFALPPFEACEINTMAFLAETLRIMPTQGNQLRGILAALARDLF
jgi:HK97 family phage prohead protease